MHVMWFNNDIAAMQSTENLRVSRVFVKYHGNHSCELKPRKTDIGFDEVLKGGMRKGPSQLQKEYLCDMLKKRNPKKKLHMI